MPRKKEKTVALLVDSLISTPFPMILSQIRHLLEEIGEVKISKIVLLQQQAIDFSTEIAQEGFLPVIIHGDLDIQFALEAMTLIYNEKIEILALATENEKFLPLFSRARELGKEVILLQPTGDGGRGLQNAADLVLSIDK